MSAIDTFIAAIQDLPVGKQTQLLSAMFDYSGELYLMRTEQITEAMAKIDRAIPTESKQAA